MSVNMGDIPINELRHYGVKGMKWGVKKDREGVRKSRGATIDRTLAAYSTEKGAGRRWVSGLLTGGISVGYNYQRSAGYSRGSSFATTMLAGPPGNILAVELSSRRASVDGD